MYQVHQRRSEERYAMVALAALGGALIGGLAMYFLDPRRGQTRRSWVRAGVRGAYHEATRSLGRVAEDSRNRLRGVAAGLRGRLIYDEGDDYVIVDRVRTSLGRILAHPGAIRPAVKDGIVTLRGPVLAHEVDPLLHMVAHVRGVKGVRSELEVHETAGNIPQLQGPGRHAMRN